jgi:hypothetical protein
MSNPFCWFVGGDEGSKVDCANVGGDLKERAHWSIPELGLGAVVDRFWFVENGVWGEMDIEDVGVSLGWVELEADIC